MAKFNEYDYGSTDFAQSNDFNSLENEKRAWRIKIETKIEDAEKSIKDNTNKAKNEINSTVNTSTKTITNKLDAISSTANTNQSYLVKIMHNLKIKYIKRKKKKTRSLLTKQPRYFFKKKRFYNANES